MLSCCSTLLLLVVYKLVIMKYCLNLEQLLAWIASLQNQISLFPLEEESGKPEEKKEDNEDDTETKEDDTETKEDDTKTKEDDTETKEDECGEQDVSHMELAWEMLELTCSICSR